MNRQRIFVALVGDYQSDVTAHKAIPVALALAGNALGVRLIAGWVPTEEITSDDRLKGCDGVWCVPASPYRNTDGALRAIRFAREQNIPFLGTCGGFQHAVIEYARNALDWHDVAHAETDPLHPHALVSPLRCSLVEEKGEVFFEDGTIIRAAYGGPSSIEPYHCRYGINPDHREALFSGLIRVGAKDRDGDIRSIELQNHPFFVATLFQPERAALDNRISPIVRTFVQTMASARL